MRAWTIEEIGGELRGTDIAKPELRGGGALLEVLAVHVPAYTREVVSGGRNYSFPAPAVMGPGCIGRVEDVAADVFGVRPGEIVINSSLLGTGRTEEPSEILVGWTGVGWRGLPTGETRAMQELWRDGACAEFALAPKESLVALPGAEGWDPARLAFLGWLSVAAEGLVRAEQSAGQVVTVLGATGQMGTAATLVALARGAGRVVAAGRNKSTLDELAAVDPRIVPVPLSGDREADATALLDAGGGSDVVLDALGMVPSAEPTMAGYDSLRPSGTMVLVGGVRQELPVPYGQIMRRRQTIRGSWMAGPETTLSVWRLVQAGLIDLEVLDPRRVSLDDPAGGLEVAAESTGLHYAVLVP
ncbi:zinc-binding dehydrogenase [Amycolatopsis acidicola]|uniref:Zinc-binding dehydrogenase n=1 Tax=Amycolatopsis acidicola TaxID=2596893 RepID=A0A5N0UYP3_9PSEU|nr:zinc-binding dehydrogenase [Amycolatopsis acidicola]KAA9158754.1 zinc-binding dehydrogenase [Amycolatopsis acidicola]